MAKKISELRETGISELEDALVELRADLSRERALISSGTKPENPGKIKRMKKTIARILTVMNEKKAGKGVIKKNE